MFILVIAIAAAIFIALPFFKKGFEKVSEETDNSNPVEHRLNRLNSEKESLYNAIKELDFDYNMGKLSKEDYGELDKKYKAQAIALLSEIDDIQSKTHKLNLEQEIEKEIKAIRGSGSAYEEPIEREILEARESKINRALALTCSKCGSEYKTIDKFCSNCGTRVYE
ncbi:MAG: zinc ribbon domain-containing protein [Candidatus Dadabacteria bacterium]|nr:zinc ribbon domain-containing protein [Candidatus Dadabacteria bacterium]